MSRLRLVWLIWTLGFLVASCGAEEPASSSSSGCEVPLQSTTGSLPERLLAVVPRDRAVVLELSSDDSADRLLAEAAELAKANDPDATRLGSVGLVPADGPYVLISFLSTAERDERACDVVSLLQQLEPIQSAKIVGTSD